MKKIILFSFFVFILTGCYNRGVIVPLEEQEEPAGKTYQQQQLEEGVKEEDIIGKQRDEHGCLGPAGYSWDEEAGACLRTWEIKEDGYRRAIKIAVEHLGWEEDATVIEVQLLRCPGCFIVKLERNSTNERKSVNINNWEVEKVSLTPEECLALGGEPLNTVGGATCAEDEENLGEVTGFISPNICCVPKDD